MRNVIRLILIGAVVIIAYDFLSALISSITGIQYAFFSVGSFLLYVIFGFLAGLNSKWFQGIVAGAVMGLAESTIGWAISWYLGPGKPSIEMNVLLIAGTIIFVVLLASILGLIGGLVSLLFKRSA
jgi:hypothetical protein